MAFSVGHLDAFLHPCDIQIGLVFASVKNRHADGWYESPAGGARFKQVPEAG
jgi:hypothetical protein